jgi:thioredoxin:protein disulfide reductase
VRVLPGREMPIPGADAAATVVSGSTMTIPPHVGAIGAPSSVAPNIAVNTVSVAEGAEAALRSGKFWKVVGAFFLGGLALSRTPCVLPMVPILSSIIVGQGAGTSTSRGRSFALSVSYSLGMALFYTALGVGAGLAGQGLAATLQNPWMLSAFALLLVGLSLSMFGVYELQLPASFTSLLNSASQKLPAGQIAGVFAMGSLSALIVSPCVAAPVAAALLFISQTRDVVLGGTGLFALSVGMSVPLLLVGASAGTLLPRTGAWMNDVKHIFGVLLVAVALWIVQPVLPATVALGLWGALLVASAARLRSVGGLARSRQRCSRSSVRSRLSGRRQVAPIRFILCPILLTRAPRQQQSRFSRLYTRSWNSTPRSTPLARRGVRSCSISTPTGVCRARRWNT